MSGVRTGSRLQQLHDLRRQITLRIEHARRTGTPAADLLDLATRVDNEIRAEGGTPPPPPGLVVVARRTGRGPDRQPRARHRADLLLADLGVTAAVVRAWALEHGLLPPERRHGRLSAAVVESYALAHIPLDQTSRKATP